AACLRLARRHGGLTVSNPSVGTLLVRDGVVVGRGITAKGGRPHAERVAIDEAGTRARGSTAYVSLEPCAHHGVTPPCAEALIAAGVARVVTAYIDPDDRVDGRGHTMLRDAGIEVNVGCCTDTAGRDLAAYLTRKTARRPHVTLKLAVSADGFIGRQGRAVPITGPLAVAYGHRMRAELDAIAIGGGTVSADDPSLTCRLTGLQSRSPQRFVFARALAADTILAQTAREVPTTLVSTDTPSADLLNLGVRHMPVEVHEGVSALPEVLEDMASTGISSLMVEGGAKLARSFLKAGVVDRVTLFRSPNALGDGIAAPTIPDQFRIIRELRLGPDTLQIFEKA
ncbi:MAG: bifunctional diaminohydroxyphosphoribosylaminopyrimidine deaminase/5-amino-6-(5-phosphoribosylamino)uracil reductase RibD, partial [Pseudomonadota bacterium]